MIGKNIKKAREKKGLKQEDFANLLTESISFMNKTVGKSAVSNWENERNNPDLEFLPFICEILDIDANFLFSKSSSNEYDKQIKKIATNNGVEISYAKEKPITAEDVVDVNKALMEELSKNNKN